MDLFLKLRKDLCDTMNNSELPLSAKYFILKDVFAETSAVYDEYVLQQHAMSVSEPQSHTKKIDFDVDQNGKPTNIRTTDDNKEA